MKPAQHVVASGITAVFFFGWVQSGGAAFVCFLSGVLIDLDHLFDYIADNKKIPSHYQEFFRYCVFEIDGRFFLFLHSYEFLLLFWLGISYFHLNVFWIAVAFGMTIHLILDTIFNPLKLLAYFLFYRINNKFERRRLLKPQRIKQND